MMATYIQIPMCCIGHFPWASMATFYQVARLLLNNNKNDCETSRGIALYQINSRNVAGSNKK